MNFMKMQQNLCTILLCVVISALFGSGNHTTTEDSTNLTSIVTSAAVVVTSIAATATTAPANISTTSSANIFATTVGRENVSTPATVPANTSTTATVPANYFTTATIPANSSITATVNAFTTMTTAVTTVPVDATTAVPAASISPILIWVEKMLGSSGQSLLVSLDIAKATARRRLLFRGEASSQFWAVAMDYRRSLIYYTDFSKNYFGVYNVQNNTHKILLRGLSYGIDGLAVDWFTGNVYWTDTELHHIMVGDPTLAHYSQVVRIDSLVPAKIAIDPAERSLFWSERTRAYCVIYRSDLTGNNRVLLHNLTDTMSIDEMVVDVNEKRLYWTDRVLNSPNRVGRVRSLSLNSTSNITTHLISPHAWFIGLGSFQNNLYLTNQRRRQLIVYNKVTGIARVILTYLSGVPRALVVYHPSVQPLSDAHHQAHPCIEDDCEQLCLTDGWDSHVCACAIGYQLQNDNTSCGVTLVADNFALLLDESRQTIYQVSLDNPDEYSALPIDNVGAVHSVDYDYRDNKIYWCDTNARKIFRSSLNGEEREIFISDVRAFSLGIDHFTRNLYIADATSDSIVVASLELPNITATLHVNDVHSVWKLVVSHSLGKVFWSDWGQNGQSRSMAAGRIESINLDGSERTVVANDSLSPHGLTLDEQSSTLFWTEIVDASIRWHKLDTGENGEFSLGFNRAAINFVVGLSYHEGFLYITDLELPSINRVAAEDVLANTSPDGTQVQPFGPTIFYSLSGVRIVNRATVIHTGSSACSNLSSSCPQICLPRHANHTCVCAHHSDYIADNNTCTQVRSSEDNTPPSFGTTCPTSGVYLVDRCSKSRLLNFTLPVPRDESGVAAFKPAQSGTPPYNLSLGSTTFSYRAFDPSGNVGACAFTVLVLDVSPCSNFPSLPEGAQIRSRTCGSQYGSVVSISCPGSTDIQFQYECSAFNGWRSVGDPDCSPIPVTTESPAGNTSVPVTNASTEATSSAGNTSVPVTNASTPAAASVGNRSGGPSGLSGGAIAAIVIVIILVIAVGLILSRRHLSNSWLSMKVLWNRGDDAVTLTADPFRNDGYDSL